MSGTNAASYDPWADLYDLQYADYRDDLPFYTRLAGDYGGPVLELGCGTGRVTAALARRGTNVVGVEIAPAMLERARERVQRDGAGSNVTLLEGDMRAVRLERRFPLVLLPFNTFMHAYTVADQDATLATVRAHLEPGGLLALDLYAPNFNELNVLRLEREWSGRLGERTELFLVQSRDEDAQVLESRYFVDSTDEDGVVRRRSATLRQRYFTRFELERALLAAGFVNVRLFGSFDRSRWTSRSPHLIALATAPA